MKNKYILFTIMLFSAFGLKAQSVTSSSFNLMLKGMLSHSVNEVSVDDIDLDSNIIFVDARELKEFEVSHLKNAIHVGFDQLDLSPLNLVAKNAKIVVYCSIGYRSEKVAEKLIKKGFKDVSNLYGGIFEWKNEGKTVVDQKNDPTEEVHAFSKIWGIWLNKGKKVY